MKKNKYAKPESIFGFVLLLLFSLFLFTTCKTSGDRSVLEYGENVIMQTNRSMITFQNNTPFRVNITVGSMQTELKPIEPKGTLTVPNIYSETEIYYLSFDIPLISTNKNYDLTGIRPAGTANHLQIGGTNNNQAISIDLPSAFDTRDSYIVVANNSSTGGVYLSENQTFRLVCVHEHRKSNIDQHETEVFRITPQNNKILYLSGPVNVSFPKLDYMAGYVYYFTYNGNSVTLADARPLHRAGETSWAYPVINADYPAQIVIKDKKIYSYASTNRGLISNVYDSAGNTKKSNIPCGEKFNIRYAANSGENFFIAGYKERSNNAYRPVARIIGTDGQVKFELDPSSDAEYLNAYFLTCAHNDNTWLLAGGSASHPSRGYTAYIRFVREENGRLTVIREIGGSIFEDKNSGIKRGEIKSAVYDNTGNCWIVTGENIGINNTSGSFIARINSDGKLDKLDASSFAGMSFNKILANIHGVYFLAGEEQTGGKTYASLIKYNINDGKYQRLSDQIPSHSYYHDMIIDEANNRILLAGVMQAKTETGKDGTPFIEAVNLENGKMIWRENISVSLSKGTSLVTSIIKAPDYGFAISLSGLENYYKSPFIIARVNSQGKYIEEIRK